MRVMVYVYATNVTLSATVGAQGHVRDVQPLPATQPEIPRELATQIAVASPETAQAL